MFVGDRFGQDDLKGVAERLEVMVGSMDVLKDMPEAEDRAATLRDLQQKLQGLLHPKLLEARGVSNCSSQNCTALATKSLIF